MKFYSLNNQHIRASFKEAVIAGIAPDKGLYFPEKITPLNTDFFQTIEKLSNHEIAFKAIHQFVNDDIPDEVLKEIIANTLDFEFPVVDIEKNVASLELFHGPTMAFKDVGARFMANCLGYFSHGQKQDVTVLVATSGDTGGAVANGFLGVDGVKVVILYPSGKVSEIQEKQLTTLGQNIEAMEVDGVFDDCQRMVKTAFLDTEITDHKKLTSANSINVARWLPQLFYFLFAYKQAKSKGKDIVFSVPSGNFGNVCAGMVAQKLGMPVKHFVASTNVNDVVPKYMEKGVYEPVPSVATISNAMDVGDPSNFVRIRHLYQNDLETLQNNLSSYSFSDEATKKTMKEVYTKTGYVMDPHGAVGYLGLKEYQKSHPDTFGIFLETAHPVKFLDVVEATLGISPAIPAQIQKVMDKVKKSHRIANYEELKQYLLQH
ncbi:MAG: threonine synthase [Muricauda sp.]|jgi:threonine synthase|nr:threonine synthase [Allomuricauda sp.]MBO6532527.1 threonine synthase [Allomuricauda sp.]MBO6590305.1 threonine synthase [Allomuricauda sp.]MBO6619931.1 threonine synthase [Allomuricauda sp.]MBO6645727.1 threonine synthase [Allomuricauda sp.]MBO6748269.1 threonine synthase [Allomuricauda sp.]